MPKMTDDPRRVASDLEISQAAALRPIREVAAEAGIREAEFEPYGHHKAKVSLEILRRLEGAPVGKYILVTAITPTPFGEGKTLTSIGLAQAIRRLRKRVFLCLREPSMGPVFGIKGGACGGGYSQVVPMEDINLHFTGDIHATSIANNLLAAMIDASLWHKNPLNIDPLRISWRRVLDVNDVALRWNVTGLGGERGGIPRETGWDMGVASEVHAVLALATSVQDLRQRLGRIQIGYTRDGKPVTAEDLQAAGAMTVLLKEALKPNLVQTLEGGPAFVHCGPFANIAHGNSSVIADLIALRLADYVCTEAGFGADCGAEKLFDIKCRQAGLRCDAAVLVASVRALKMHGGAYEARPGRKLPDDIIAQENVDATLRGCDNMAKHIENLKLFGVPVVVAVNVFPTDHASELAVAQEKALEAGADAACLSEAWAKGGEGALELAEEVVRAADRPSDFRLLYPDDAPIKSKIEAIATRIYGARGVEYSTAADRKIEEYTEQGLTNLPICMAKTQYSLSHDASLKGRPTGFTVPILDVRPSLGAGFLYPLLGDIMTMPALPTRPAAHGVDIDEHGETVGLF